MGTPRHVVASRPGDSSVLQIEPITIEAPGEGDVLLRHTAIGVNFIDVYFRQGLYPWPDSGPLTLGSEAAAVVEAVGAGVDGFAPGDRVAYTRANGAYATHRSTSAADVVPLPESIGDETAAGAMLKGLTAYYLLHDSFPVKRGHTVLFHAAAGGVGSLAGQWLASLGVRAIGTAGGAEKCRHAAANGYWATIDYRQGGVVDQVMDLTDGQGVDAVYDSVGADTLRDSLDCLRRFGTLVSFGQSSGPPDQFRIGDLAAGSLRLTRPTLFHFTADRAWLERASTALFNRLESGEIVVPIDQRFALDQAAQAHHALENRETTGCTVLLP